MQCAFGNLAGKTLSSYAITRVNNVKGALYDLSAPDSGGCLKAGFAGALT